MLTVSKCIVRKIKLFHNFQLHILLKVVHNITLFGNTKLLFPSAYDIQYHMSFDSIVIRAGTNIHKYLNTCSKGQFQHANFECKILKLQFKLGS